MQILLLKKYELIILKMKKIIFITILLFISCDKKTRAKSVASPKQQTLKNAMVAPDTVSYNKVNIYLKSQVPNFIAQDENKKKHQLIDLKNKKNLILVFFRGYW